jgi:hypothetical protein
MRLHSLLAARSRIVVPVVLGLALAAFAGGCTSHGSATESPSSTPSVSPSPSQTGPNARSADEFYADLARAIRTAKPSMSAKALEAHIRAVTKAPFAIIVAPYDPGAESESEKMSRTEVAFWGIDGALATDMEGFVHDSRGRPFRSAEEAPGYGARLFLAGHPIKVGERDGYVLIGMPAQ